MSPDGLSIKATSKPGLKAAGRRQRCGRANISCSSPMSPSPLEDRLLIRVLQRPCTLALPSCPASAGNITEGPEKRLDGRRAWQPNQQLPSLGRRSTQRKASLQHSPGRQSRHASGMRPLKCGCRGCWRLMRREEARGCGWGGAASSLRRLGCLPALGCISCDPGVRSLGSSCSFCSSDPIIGPEPRVGGSWRSGRGSQQQAGVILDCRGLVEYTKMQLQGAMGLGWPEGAGLRRGAEQAKVAVFDLLSGRAQGTGSRLQGGGRPAALRLVVGPLGARGEEMMQGDASEGPVSAPSSEPSGGPEAGDAAPEPPLTPDVEDAELSPVLPFLYLGNERDAQDLGRMRQLGVGYVINVTTHLPLYHAHAGTLRYKRLPAIDSAKQNLRQYFEEAFEFIEEAQQSGRGVLVHCQAGVSRSATLVIAYLMKHTLMTVSDAYKYVKGRRPVISPNLNFMGQLLEFEMDLNKGLTPRILTPKLAGLETEV
ncbi:dual specificity protein phosphatase 10-like [Narcine bancroftii]|uniref:dual specificity protein phosphatase 10-like n=1 Tax=Narcine bancroftii TaxID=1343680 RepID=UPI003831EF5D